MNWKWIFTSNRHSLFTRQWIQYVQHSDNTIIIMRRCTHILFWRESMEESWYPISTLHFIYRYRYMYAICSKLNANTLQSDILARESQNTDNVWWRRWGRLTLLDYKPPSFHFLFTSFELFSCIQKRFVIWMVCNTLGIQTGWILGAHNVLMNKEKLKLKGPFHDNFETQQIIPES